MKYGVTGWHILMVDLRGEVGKIYGDKFMWSTLGVQEITENHRCYMRGGGHPYDNQISEDASGASAFQIINFSLQ